MKKTFTIQLVRNATLKIRYTRHIMLIDPVLADKGTLISTLGVNKTPKAHLAIPIQDIIGGMDMILLTHNHIDYYEPSVPAHSPKEIPFCIQPQDTDAIRNDGFTSVIPIEKIKTIDGMSIYRTTGHHGFGQIGQMTGPVSGYVLKAEGFSTVYIMGNCRWEACIRDTVERFNPGYIVVNSGDAIFPEFFKTDGPIISGRNEMIQILDELPSHIKLIAVRMGAIGHCRTTRAVLRNEATHHEADVSQLIIPENGETVVLRVSALNP